MIGFKLAFVCAFK